MVLQYLSTTMGFSCPALRPSPPLPRPPYPASRFEPLDEPAPLPHHALATDLENDGAVVLIATRSKTTLLTEDMSRRLDQLAIAGSEHPLIAPVIGIFDAGTTWNVVYFLHDRLMPMRTLAQDVASKDGYTEAQLHRKAFALVDALHYLHTRGIVHGNLTIHHLYIAGDRLQLLLPPFLDLHTATAMHPPTPHCKAADIFAFGALIYLLTTGHDPHLNVIPDSVALQSLTVPAQTLVLECLSHELSRRPTTTMLLHRQWFSFQKPTSHRYTPPRSWPSFHSSSSSLDDKETLVKMPDSGSLLDASGLLLSDEPLAVYSSFDALSYEYAVPAYQPFTYTAAPVSTTRRLTNHIRTTHPVARSLQLPVHFSAFGPPAWDTKCRVFIWACAPHQFEDMLAMALDEGVIETGRLSRGLRVTHGTMITIALEPCVGLSVVGESAKSFQWVEEMEKVFFDLKLVETNEDDVGRLCRARIIVGTHVAILHFTIPPPTMVRHDDDDSEARVVTYPSSYTPLDVPPPEAMTIPLSSLTLLEPIGAGSFGTAYRARYKNAEVVVKKLKTDVLSSVSRHEFLHEVRALSMLGKHPHVVEFLGACDDELALVMEYVPNGSVETLLYDSEYYTYGVYPRTIFARDAAHGVLNIHQGSFLHRDIAARNCLLDADFHVKVCDFGLSRPIDRMGHVLDQPGFGPLKWMAPESLELPHVFSPASDAYMFGVLLYEIMVGTEPFGRDMPPQEAAALVLEGHRLSIDAASACPDEHRSLLAACLRSDPQARPSMMDIARTLDDWLRANALSK
ncbi:serine/threonine protein kinase [Saprolegnia parasitica CBS 223.65]|uniref:Serine/threonine protein kinase n=3 Tax=Saprolegnia parasitica (strain CBS 223.65) TaxID=695850 RepID=A0A067D7V1_SAPPC|nr:serine/threonine protein kinase [Saprolegnia parasitica CBS 223.65]KDO34701.1 serine/threonine protein kinase [Saprolegnia parasitica CBS 223.65]|eukprot:XP_012194371.1 serine/threonine protein kinase [Saprolegnia parasitica CBS 223.65]